METEKIQREKMATLVAKPAAYPSWMADMLAFMNLYLHNQNFRAAVGISCLGA